MPKIQDRKGTIHKYPGLKSCFLCGKEFYDMVKFTVVEEDGPFDNNWYAICRGCMGTKSYDEFIKNNCILKK